MFVFLCLNYAVLLVRFLMLQGGQSIFGQMHIVLRCFKAQPDPSKASEHECYLRSGR